jgi:hypothetical protein
LWFGEPSKDIEVVGVGRELKEESDIVHCPSSCGIGAVFLFATTDWRSLALTGHAVVLGHLTAVAAVSWGGAALAACAAAVVAAAVSAAAIFAALVAAVTAFAAPVVAAAATIAAAAAVAAAVGAAAVGATAVALERKLGWRWDALLSSQSARLCLSFSNLLGFAVRFLDFFLLTAVLPAGVSLHVKLICCPPRFVCSTNLAGVPFTKQSQYSASAREAVGPRIGADQLEYSPAGDREGVVLEFVRCVLLVVILR